MQRTLYLSALALLAACSKDTTVDPKPDPGPVSIAMNVSCATGTPLSMAVGDVRSVTAEQLGALCLSSGAGSEYALVPINTVGDSSKSVTVTVSSTGIATAQSSLSRAPTSTPSLFAGGVDATEAVRYTRNAAFDARLRADEHALFSERAAAARAAFESRATRAGGPLFSVAASVPAIGSFVKLNANSTNSCSSPDLRTGRVVAITNNAIVVADTSNPANGFTDADYQSIGVQFDTLAYVVDTLNFGAPVDIDANGNRAVIFFTKAVNDLTPTTSDSYVGGFFYGRDLYPKTTSGGLQGCAGSNFGEMFYTLVPDAVRAGSDTTSPFSKNKVRQTTVAVLAHEFQHLINLSRRLYVTKTAIDEDTWLNEGLSHVAEELVFYRASGFAPRQNLSLSGVQAGGLNGVRAFNQFQLSNAGRLITYLQNTEGNSPIAGNDSLETRGATWSLLRYAADRRGGTERSTWYPLVNSNTRGLANLQNVFGAAAFGGSRPWIRDWAVSTFTDDALPVATAYTQPSWNDRSLLPALTRSGQFPLATRKLAAGTPTTVKLLSGGGVAYLKFGVGTETAPLPSTTNAVPDGVDLMLVRIK